MKLVSFLKTGKEKYGVFYEDKIYDLPASGIKHNITIPGTILQFLNEGDKSFDAAKKITGKIAAGEADPENKQQIRLLAPVPHPVSLRDGYAFRQHVATARRNRGVEMIPEFDQFPVFYYGNHNSICGEGDIMVEEDHLLRLDFELEAAIVIGKKGRNIPAEKADEYIAGYMTMNDLSARALQSEEMKLNMGPVKGKDFATAAGPWLVTTDELEKFLIVSEKGNKYNMRMTAVHNGNLVSDGNLKDMNWTFAEIIERASYGIDLYPGDIIGSGTVGTGCYLELNGTGALQAKEKGEKYNPVWLQEGDVIELEISGLGILKNRIVKTNNNYSILKKKKMTNAAL